MDTVVPRRKKKTTADTVIQAELRKAHDLHPGYLMASSVLSALREAGFSVLSHDDLDGEIALAFDAGHEEGCGVR